MKVHSGPLAAALAVGLMLQGCANAPVAHRPVVASPPPAPAAQAPKQIIEMAPIPNPPEPERATHVSHTSASRHEERIRAADEEAKIKAETHAEPPVDHAKAARLRAQGLEQLDRGQINRAVQLLQAASQLDPGNALIQHDLERALRISKAVQSRR